MDLMQPMAAYRAIRVRAEGGVCHITLARPETGNTINRTLVDEIGHALDTHEASAAIVVLEASPEVFCLGADFQGIAHDQQTGMELQNHVPEPLYDLWLRLATGPFVSVAHVRGKVNAGGIGFVAACDVVLCDESAVFSLSEMMFGLVPACVLPFLIGRIGFARANYLTLGTQSLPARQALQWGLVDACDENSENLLRKHLLRLARLSKPAIARYKRYAAELDGSCAQTKTAAVRANLAAFSDPVNLANISRYVATGRFPWEHGS